MKQTTLIVGLFFAIWLLPLAALAHTGAGLTTSLAAGLRHPFFGLDHLLAMIAVGLWAVMVGGRTRWAIPAAFVGAMIVGGTLNLNGLALPLVQPMIASSVLVLGLLIAAASRLPLGWGMALVALFALFHGHAHGNEMPLNASGLIYGLGFTLATASLHGLGLGIGTALQRFATHRVTRFAGAGIALAGLFLLAA